MLLEGCGYWAEPMVSTPVLYSMDIVVLPEKILRKGGWEDLHKRNEFACWHISSHLQCEPQNF